MMCIDVDNESTELNAMQIKKETTSMIPLAEVKASYSSNSSTSFASNRDEPSAPSYNFQSIASTSTNVTRFVLGFYFFGQHRPTSICIVPPSAWSISLR